MFKVLLRNGFTQVGFSLSVVLKTRTVSASTSWAQSISQATVLHTLQRVCSGGAFESFLVYRSKSRGFVVVFF